MEIIVPAAGLSTRFPDMKPKYLLRDDNGEMMLKKALQPYLDYEITVGLLLDHVKNFDAFKEVQKEFNNSVNTVVLPEVTRGPADTVFQIIESADIQDDSPILIKDCDSYFDHEIVEGNYICISQVEDNDLLFNLAGKSFVKTNEQGIITDIIEKQVVSNKFCVGGYKFDSSALFVESYEEIANKTKNEIFVSHVIQNLLMNDYIFFENLVSNYHDVGTINEWKKYNESIAK